MHIYLNRRFNYSKGMKSSKYDTPKHQLLKWIGNKQRHADAITRFFPQTFKKYHEPFLGSGAILATLSPKRGVGSDAFSPLMEIWTKLKNDPDMLVEWYDENRRKLTESNKTHVYARVLKRFNNNPNGADFLFLVRSCYGGVIRFRKEDGFMSTPCGEHMPISTESFSDRVKEWHPRVKSCDFAQMDYTEAFANARNGDLIYCDPPYHHSQGILYGAHSFDIEELFSNIEKAKSKGAHVALSIDGIKKSGDLICKLPIPKNLFEKQVFINNGSSMLKRFQLDGLTTDGENVKDRLLLTYSP